MDQLRPTGPEAGNFRTGRVAVAGVLTVILGLTGLGSTSARPNRQDALEQAEARLMELEKDFELVVERYNIVHERLVSIRLKIDATQSEARAIERRMASREREAIRVATQLYKAGAVGALEPLLTARSVSEIETRLRYLTSSEAAHRRLFERLYADRSELNAVLARLGRQQEQVAATESQLSDLRTTIEAKVADQKDEISALAAAIERAEDRRRARREAARRAAAARQAAARATARQPTTVEQPSAPARPAPAPSSAAQVAVNAALSQVGKPYQWGGAGPDSYDCSGLTMWAWAHAGVALPHSSQMQFSSTARVSESDWQAGDLLFFGSPIHHVGLYIGNGRMVEAPYTGLSVRVVSAYRSDYAGAGRPGV